MPFSQAARAGLPRRPVAAALLVAVASLLLPRASPGRVADYVVERGGRSVELPTRTLGRREVVDLGEAARFFGLDLRRDRKRLELVGDAGRITLTIGRAAVQVDGEAVVLQGEVDVEDGRVFVPVDFLTRAIPRLFDETARLDPSTRVVRFESTARAASCEEFDDRVRVTIAVPSMPHASEVETKGNERRVVLDGVELPAQEGGCTFGDILTDLTVEPLHGRTQLTFFVGDRFRALRVLEVETEKKVVFDFLSDAAPAPAPQVAEAPARPSDNFDLVVIDAGHGGEDRGAVGAHGLAEKDVTLALAQELAKRLRERGIEAILTRSTDATLGLVDRTEIANRARADLFISIHANASPVQPAFGAETYFLSLDATDEQSRTLAALESDATGLRSRGQGGGNLELVLWDLAQQQYLEESSHLAEAVQQELNTLAGTRDRGVKQANFLVLRGAAMPAVLVEVGFLSNPTEERAMGTPEFKQATADALARAVFAFQARRLARTAVP
jgi:N-acetylmuramoyl-L-alanine amidase